MNESRERKGNRYGNQSGNMMGGPLGGNRGGQRGRSRGSMPRQRYGNLPNLGPQPPPMQNPSMWPSGMPQMPHGYMPPPHQSTGLGNYPGQQPNYPLQLPNYPPGGPPPMYDMPLLPNLQQPLMQKPERSPAAGSATLEAKDPVTALNEYEPLVTYMECATQNDVVCMIAEIQGKQFEGYAMTKKDAKKDAAKKALKDLFNIVCVEDMGDNENAAEKVFVEVDTSSDNDSENNFNSHSSRARGINRRNRGKGNRGGRMRGAFRQSGSMQNLSTRNDSDNESISSETSQPVRGRGGRNQRGGRGRGRRGRGAMSEKSYYRSQEKLGSNVESKTQQDSAEFADNADDSFSEAKVFRHLVTTLGGCVTLSKFKETFSDLPENFEEWIKMPRNRLSVFKSGDKPLVVGPFLKDATLCVDHMGFGGKKNCQRKDCNHFHICNFYLNGWCKRGFKCRKGHTFTKGHNRELKAKLGLNPFKDAEIKTIILCRYPQVCPKSKCRKEECPNLHVCFNFLRDKCEDSNCSRGHDLKTPHNLWVLSVYRMQKWVEDRLALLKFLINKPRKPRIEKASGDDTASRVDDTESIGTVDDDDDDNDFEENLEDDDKEDEGDDDDSDEEDNEDEKEEMAQDVYHYPGSFQRELDALKTEESLPKKKLDRRNRWAADTEREEFIDRAEIAETSGCLPSTSGSVTEKDADKKDICTNVIAGSCQGKRCDKHHTVLPYLWQVRIFGSWVSFNDQENQNIEKSYCSLGEIQDAEVDHDERKYKIHMKFNENTGVVYEIMQCNESLNTNDVLSTRRLSTASLAKEKKPLTTGSFHTQWRWHFQDDNGQWILFDKERFQYTLERKYVLGQKTYLFTRESYRFKYRIEFADWKQINIETGKERRILRRPLFVSMTDVTSKSYPQILAVPAPGPKPPGWVPWDLAHDFELVDLEESSNEYKIVKSSIFDTLKEDCFQVCNIYRIQNLGLWNEYKMKKTNMERENELRGGDVNEKHLFHGTDSIDTCYGICTNNFDFRLSGKNATMYGKGSYFAVTAKYSNCYTRGPVRLMFRARVLIGQYTKGEKDIVCPPNIPGAGHKRYDSCVDNENNPCVFVVFDRNQSYPEHLIAYKEKEDDSRPTPSSANSGSSGGVQSVQASYSGAKNFTQSAQSSTAQPSYTAGASIGATQPTSYQRQSYSNPYAPSPGISTSPGTSEALPGSQSLSYRTAAGREERMFYPEPKKKDESCCIQ